MALGTGAHIAFGNGSMRWPHRPREAAEGLPYGLYGNAFGVRVSMRWSALIETMGFEWGVSDGN